MDTYFADQTATPLAAAAAGGTAAETRAGGDTEIRRSGAGETPTADFQPPPLPLKLSTSTGGAALAAPLGASPRIDHLEAHLAQLPQAECPVTHRFTPGLYAREIRMAAGTLLTSKIHKTEHPYVISQGAVSVWTEAEGVVHLRAPHTGITRPGTRRVLYIHEDTVWTTFHPTLETDVDKIEAAIIEPHRIPTLSEGDSPWLGTV